MAGLVYMEMILSPFCTEKAPPSLAAGGSGIIWKNVSLEIYWPICGVVPYDLDTKFLRSEK